MANDQRDFYTQGLVEGLKNNMACIEFEPDGTILEANELFLGAMGYRLDEVVGQHHSIFMPEDEVGGAAYANHWRRVASGEALQGTFKRIRKDGAPVWIAAIYCPLRDQTGRIYRAFKVAVDVTANNRLRLALIAGLTDLSTGRFDQPLEGSFGPEGDEVRDQFNGTLAKLGTIFNDLTATITNLSTLAEGMSDRALDLTQRSTRLSGAVSEVSDATQHLVTGSTEMRDTSCAGRLTAERAAKAVGQSGAIISNSVHAMSQVETMTSDIAKITKVLAGFATQTNLLSINAGIEAARAGDAGLGFAVVAQEVRGLAERSRTASNDISVLIDRSARHVQEAVAAVSEASERLRQIDSSVQETDQSVAAIDRRIEDQGTAIKTLRTVTETMNNDVITLATMAKDNGSAASIIGAEIARLRQSLHRLSVAEVGTASPKSTGTTP